MSACGWDPVGNVDSCPRGHNLCTGHRGPGPHGTWGSYESLEASRGLEVPVRLGGFLRTQASQEISGSTGHSRFPWD